ncbi:MAG: TIGR02757 family protein [Bacteroidota bacterium]
MEQQDFKAFLDEQVERFNQPGFIPDDPISIPHQYTRLQDIEITGFWTSVLAWGQRVTIIRKCNELFEMMDNAPYDFILNHKESDLKPFEGFKHRTFNATDTLYFIHWLSQYYREHTSLEDAFCIGIDPHADHMEDGLVNFHKSFFDLPDSPDRTRKHIATPSRKSACKRLNMFLRWMVRDDKRGVDFGLWKKIKPSQLVCPCDLHVDRVARRFNLVTRKGTDWLTALELTTNLKKYDPKDPVKYDFALFGLGALDDY